MEQRVFDSWDDLDRFMDDYGRRTFQLFRKRTSTSVKLRNRRMLAHASTKSRNKAGEVKPPEPPRLIPEHYINYSLTLVCTHSGAFVSRGKGKRSRQAVRATECDVQVNACLKLVDPRCDLYRVCITRAMLLHNHPVDEQTFLQYSQMRLNLPDALLDCVELMRKTGVKARDVRAYIVAHSSCAPTVKDVRNLLNRLRSQGEMAEQQQQQPQVVVGHPNSSSEAAMQRDSLVSHEQRQPSERQTNTATPDSPVLPTTQFHLANDMGKRMANLLAEVPAAKFPAALRVLELAENIVRGNQTGSTRRANATTTSSAEASEKEEFTSGSGQELGGTALSRLKTLEDGSNESE